MPLAGDEKHPKKIIEAIGGMMRNNSRPGEVPSYIVLFRPDPFLFHPRRPFVLLTMCSFNRANLYQSDTWSVLLTLTLGQTDTDG